MSMSARAFPFALHAGVLALLPLLGPSSSAAPSPRPTILQVYATAETTTSATVVWNTDVASDSSLRYSTLRPVPPDAPRIHVPAQVSVHQVPLEGLAPATLYHFEVTSCTRRGCASATGSFDTFPTCPDLVPAVPGSWQRVPSPNVGTTTPLRNELLGVAALSEDHAWAVGWAQEPGAPPYVKRTLTQRWDGRTWSLVPSPSPAGDVHSVLHAVAAVSPQDVWAVGSTHDGTLPSRTLIAHWDGTRWSLVPTPSPDPQLNELRGVAALSASDVWAVGYRGGTQADTPLEGLVLHWDGTVWSVVPTPSVPGGANQLSGIGAISEREIWAVGSAGGAPLSLRWDGTAWSVVPLERDRGLGTERLTAVSGTSDFDVWVVGEGRGVFTSQLFATLRHWNGKRWVQKICRAASASNPPDGYEGGGPDAYLTGVSAAAPDDVWAVGVRGSGPMILHWDGVAWTAVTHARALPNSAVLRGVATAPGAGAWAVGLEIEVDPSGSASPERTRIDRYAP